MRTRYLIIAMLVAVAIFVAKGFYVTQDVRQSTLASYQQFEFFSDRVHPLIDSYDEDVVGMIVRASHGLGDIKMLCPKLQAAQEQERVMLNNYILGLRGEETMDDKEMYIRAAEISIYIDQLRAMCRVGDINGLRATIQSGELFCKFDAVQKILHKIGDNKLVAAKAHEQNVEKTLEHFDRVMLYASVLIAILAVLAVRYKEKTPRTKSRRSKKKTLRPKQQS